MWLPVAERNRGDFMYPLKHCCSWFSKSNK